MHKAGLALAALFVMGYAQLDHFDITISPGAKTAGTAFTITVEAKNAAGEHEDWTGKIYFSLPGNSYSIPSPSNVYMGGGKWTGEITVYWADRAVKIKVEEKITGKTGVSNSFSVSPGSPSRLLILFPGQVLRQGGSGKSGDAAMQMSGVPCSTWVYYTDKWYNPVNVNREIEVRITSTDKYFKTQPKSPFKFTGGQKVIISTFTQVFCPLPKQDTFRLHTVRIEATTVQADPDSSTVPVVSDTVVSKILFVCPGDTPEPGAPNGLTPDSKAKVYAFKPETLIVYGTDKAWNEVKGKYFPQDTVRLDASPPVGVGFRYGLLEDTTKKEGVLKPGGTKFLAVVTTDKPGPGEYGFTVTARAKSFPSYNKSLAWEAIPDSIEFKQGEPPDTIPVKVATTVTVKVTVGIPGTPERYPYKGEEVDFKVVEGEGEFEKDFAYSDDNGEATVKFTPTSPGPTTIKAYLHRFPEISNTKTIAVTSPKPIFIRPNPWEVGNKVKLFYVLDKDVRNVTVLISDIFGNIVWRKSYTEEDDETRAGTQIVEWDGTNMKGEKVANSIYLVKVKPFSKPALHTKIVVVR